MERCICGMGMTLEDAYLLDCEHRLCQECSRILSASPCPACRIERAVEQCPVNIEDLVSHIQYLYRRHREAILEKQNALRAKASLTSSLEHLSAARDDALEKYNKLLEPTAAHREGNDVSDDNREPKGKKRKANNLADVAKENGAKKARKSITSAPESDVTLCDPTDDLRALYEESKEDYNNLLLQVRYELDTQAYEHRSSMTDMKQQCEQIEKKAQLAEEAKRQTELSALDQVQKAEKLQSDFNDASQRLLAAEHTITQLRLDLNGANESIVHEKKKAWAYQSYAQELKMHYKGQSRMTQSHDATPALSSSSSPIEDCASGPEPSAIPQDQVDSNVIERYRFPNATGLTPEGFTCDTNIFGRSHLLT